MGTYPAGHVKAGQRRQVSVYAETQGEALRRIRAVQASEPRESVDPPMMDAFLLRWLETHVRATCTPAVHRQRRQDLEAYLIPLLGGIAVRDLAPAHVERLLGYLESQGASAYSRTRIRSTLHSAVGHALRLGIADRNPVALVAAPRLPRVAMRVWTPAEARQFLDAARTDRLYALYVVALMGGLRQGELLGLRWPDVDFSAGALVVQGSVDRDGHYDEPKSVCSVRRIEMPADAMAALRDLPRTGERVFTALRGGRVNAGNLLRRSFFPLMARAGVNRIRFHDLRHSHATHLLLAGVNPKVVSERLGHSSIEITLGIYSHVLPGLGRTAADLIGQMLGGDEGKVRVDGSAETL